MKDSKKIICFIRAINKPLLFEFWERKENLPEDLFMLIESMFDRIGGRKVINRKRTDWAIHILNGSLCIICKLDDLRIFEVLEWLSLFQQKLALNGVLITGGVSVGKIMYHEFGFDSEILDLIVKTLNELDILPRIIIGKLFLEQVELIFEDDIRFLIKEYLIRDFDSNVFVNYLDFDNDVDPAIGELVLINHKKIISTGFHHNSQTELYLWMAAFHNWYLDTVAQKIIQLGALSDDDIWDFRSLHINIRSRSFICLLWQDRMQQDISDISLHFNPKRNLPFVHSDDDEPSEDSEPNEDNEPDDDFEPNEDNEPNDDKL